MCFPVSNGLHVTSTVSGVGRFVLWDQSPCADPAALAAASHATQRSFDLMKSAESPVNPLSLFNAARLVSCRLLHPAVFSRLFSILFIISNQLSMSVTIYTCCRRFMRPKYSLLA
jgi:hypothetical protein